ncbi:MAG TPA: hypothetical protein VJP02_12110 [Candidatus Sulfotelmatobacter sp.]|nr:hypothetical protein [Candidatus Sulfotelmatobacter sp.]
MKIAGHSNIQQSMAYIHPDSKTVQAAVEKAGKKKGGHKTRHNAETAIPKEILEVAVNPSALEGYMVSAAGLEPATHALKA